jgi:hypothetical protein
MERRSGRPDGALPRGTGRVYHVILRKHEPWEAGDRPKRETRQNGVSQMALAFSGRVPLRALDDAQPDDTPIRVGPTGEGGCYPTEVPGGCLRRPCPGRHRWNLESLLGRGQLGTRRRQISLLGAAAPMVCLLRALQSPYRRHTCGGYRVEAGYP